jgi:hypothetical protein
MHVYVGGYGVIYWDEGDPQQFSDDAPISLILISPRTTVGEATVLPSTTDPFGPDLLRSIARTLLPADAVFQDTKLYNNLDHSVTTDTYYSPSLASRYMPLQSICSPWTDVSPGTVVILYYRENGGAQIEAGSSQPPYPEPTRFIVAPTRPVLPTFTPGPPPPDVPTVPIPLPTGQVP